MYLLLDFRCANFAYDLNIPPFVILLTSKLFSPYPAFVMAKTVTKYFVEGWRLLRVSESTLVLLITKHSGEMPLL